MTPEDLKRSLSIDIQALHEMCEKQPKLASEAGEVAAEAKAEAKRQDLQADEAEASAERDIRLHPEEYGLSKITESAVKSAVVLHPDVMKAKRDAIESAELADKAKNLANAFEHRRSMLNAEVDLYVNNYWGEPGMKARQMSGSENKIVAEDEAGVEGMPRRRRRKSNG